MVKDFNSFINESNNFYKYKEDDKILTKLKKIENSIWKYRHQTLKKWPSNGIQGSKKLTSYFQKWVEEAEKLKIYNSYDEEVKILDAEGNKMSYSFGDVLA